MGRAAAAKRLSGEAIKLKSVQHSIAKVHTPVYKSCLRYGIWSHIWSTLDAPNLQGAGAIYHFIREDLEEGVKMKAITHLLHLLKDPAWGERIEPINASISEYFDADVGFERVVNVWTSVDHVIDVIKFNHIRDDLREGV